MPEPAIGPPSDAPRREAKRRADDARDRGLVSTPRIGPPFESQPFNCEALGCCRPADWAYIGEGGDMFLCEFHGGPGDVEGWTRINRENRDVK